MSSTPRSDRSARTGGTLSEDGANGSPKEGATGVPLAPTEVFERQVAAFARRDVDAQLEYFGEESILRDMTEPFPRCGLAAVREYMTDYLRVVTQVETEITTLLGTNEYAIAELVISGVWAGDGPARGARVSLNYCVIDHVIDGLIQFETAYWDPGQLARQLEAHAGMQD